MLAQATRIQLQGRPQTHYQPNILPDLTSLWPWARLTVGVDRRLYPIRCSYSNHFTRPEIRRKYISKKVNAKHAKTQRGFCDASSHQWGKLR